MGEPLDEDTDVAFFIVNKDTHRAASQIPYGGIGKKGKGSMYLKAPSWWKDRQKVEYGGFLRV